MKTKNQDTVVMITIIKYIFIFIMLCIKHQALAKTIYVGNQYEYKTIQSALDSSEDGDTVIVTKGIYKEGNIIINRAISFIGKNNPVIDGEKKYEILSVKSSNVLVRGFTIRNSGFGTMNDPCGIKVYEAENVVIEENTLYETFFGIYIQFGKNCIIRNNIVEASQKFEFQSGNGIHCWKSSNLQIIGNRISGHRDGIYFEFVTDSVIWRNISKDNIRYGLHFMFSNNDAYFTNYFRNNGAGVAVMFSKQVVMMNNTFEENWGDASYGILLKEISDCYLSGNRIIRNTTGIFFDGTNRMTIERNEIAGNGWGLRIQANCMDNTIKNNNFKGNIFDVSTNGTLMLNTFSENYWDKYEGYDMDKDNIGDLPYHPLSLYSVIVEKNPPAMLLYRSFIIGLLDKSETILPSLTPQNFIDKRPLMKPLAL